MPEPQAPKKQVKPQVSQQQDTQSHGQEISPPEYGIEAADQPIQRVLGLPSVQQAPLPPPNETGMPDSLKSGIESLSGLAMDDVRVHYNSDKPAQVDALAYAQGNQIHIGPGQERHLPHEAWHVVQQKEGRVKPTMQMKGRVNINDDTGLEKEADVMGLKALHLPKPFGEKKNCAQIDREIPLQKKPVIQRALATFSEVAEGIKVDKRNTASLIVPDKFDARLSPETGLFAKTAADVNNLHRLDSPTTVSPFNLEEEGVGLRTKIEWTDQAVNTGGKNYTEGKTMKADPLGPDHKKGSSPDNNDKSADWVIRRKALDAAAGVGPGTHKAGHLLNEELGGPGNLASNLAAIPPKANSNHTKIENPVKHYVNKEGAWGSYIVDITFKNDAGVPSGLDYASKLTATWVPYGLKVFKGIVDGDPIEYFKPNASGYPEFEPIINETLTLDLDIPAPSSKTAVSDTEPVLAGGVADSNLRKIRTDIGPDEIVLDSNLSIIVRSVADKIEKYTDIVKNLTAEKEGAQVHLAKASEKVDELKKWLGFAYNGLKEVEQENDDYAKLLEVLTDSQEKLKGESTRLRRERDDADRTADRLRRERNAAEREARREAEDNERLRRERDAAEREARRLANDNERLRRQHDRLRREFDELEEILRYRRNPGGGTKRRHDD